MNKITSPLVSVCMITYNHEKYISEAIEGVLMQKTSFPIELIIGEDCSTDNTRIVCIEYQKKNPDKIRLLLPENNLGVIPNFVTTLRSATGKYIALCEGDDYWIDPYKLQKQVDFIEDNPDVSLVHTNGYWLKKGKLVQWNEWPILSGDVSETFYYGNIVRTCTALFKSKFIDEYLELLNKSKNKIIGDWPLFAFYATKGKFEYLKERMVVYRINDNSVTGIKDYKRLMNYRLDVVIMKRFLRDYLFIGKLDEIYSEEILLQDVSHLRLKYAFQTFNYKLAKTTTKENLLGLKSYKYAKFTSNRIFFLFVCVMLKFKNYIKA